jgi:hypothetical protein
MSANDLDARELIFQLHKLDGIPGIGQLPGLWERKLNERWTFWINGHMEALKGGPRKDIPVQPGDCYVEYNGWPAGSFSLIHGDGIIAAGSRANYQTFCAALRDAVAAKEARPHADE